MGKYRVWLADPAGAVDLEDFPADTPQQAAKAWADWFGDHGSLMAEGPLLVSVRDLGTGELTQWDVSARMTYEAVARA